MNPRRLTASVHRTTTKQLLQAPAPLNRRWSCQASMDKTWQRGRSQYEEVVHRLQDRGVNVYGTFVFGYDEDSAAVFDECREVEFAPFGNPADDLVTNAIGSPSGHV